MTNVIMVGAFPPPVHGMALINAAVLSKFRAAGIQPLVLDVAADDLNRSFFARLSRFPKVLRNLFLLSKINAAGQLCLYMSVSGGMGQLYEFMFVMIARVRNMRVFLHHHSYSYLNRYSLLTHLLACSSGRSANHILLSPRMKFLFRSLYGACNVYHVSNSAFLDLEASRRLLSNYDSIALGFIGNVTAEKGIFIFLDLVAALSGQFCSVRGKIAGPCQDSKTFQLLNERLAELPQIEYLGPRYGAAKDSFYQSIDILIFPSLYFNEAEPVVLLEAISRGIPVVAYAVGSIPDVITSDCGILIEPREPFVPPAINAISSFISDQTLLQKASSASSRRFELLRSESQKEFDSLQRKIVY